MSNFKSFISSRRNETGLATAKTNDLLSEISIREKEKNPFPLDVFNEKLNPFIFSLTKGYDLPRSYIGLTLLSALSTAIGTAYVVSTNRRDSIPLTVWAALVGMSSAGKSICINKIYSYLKQVQDDFDRKWTESTNGLSPDKRIQCRIETVIYRDSNIPTFVRTVMPDNPKGVVKYSDELIEWINGMNQLSKKEGTDEQFWLSSWNCNDYSGIRGMKDKFVVKKPFVNVIGGFQPKMLVRLFKNDRDSTGFVNRILFALPTVNKIAELDPSFEMPDEYQTVIDNALKRLYHDLPVYEAGESRKCILLPDAVKIYHEWSKREIKQINALPDLDDRENKAAIFGKTKEYALRFSGILHLADRALLQENLGDETRFRHEEYISSDTIIKSIQLATYFFNSAVDTYQMVQKNLTAPNEVLEVAFMLKRGATKTDIGKALYGTTSDANRVRASRQIEKWIKEYPKVFGAYAK